MSESVELERQGGVAIVRLNRPERMNALSRAMVEALGRVGRELSADSDLRVVVLTGTGDKAFCAGADLKERIGMSDSQVLEQLALYRSELAWLGDFRTPVVAAINGVALGGGLELALSCDLRLARAGALLGLPETSLGIIPGAGGTQRLPRLVGEAKAKELILLGTRLSAEQALAVGLVNCVIPAEKSLLDEALAFIRPIVEGAPIAQRAALRALRAASLPLEQGLAVELSAYQECLASEDRREALLAFQERRPPHFQGR